MSANDPTRILVACGSYGRRTGTKVAYIPVPPKDEDATLIVEYHPSPKTRRVN